MNRERKSSQSSESSSGSLPTAPPVKQKKKRAGQGSRARRKKALERERIQLLQEEAARLSINTSCATSPHEDLLSARAQRLFWSYLNDGQEDDGPEMVNVERKTSISPTNKRRNSAMSTASSTTSSAPRQPHLDNRSPRNNSPRRQRSGSRSSSPTKSRRPSAMEWLNRSSRQSQGRYEEVFKGGALALTNAVPVKSLSPRRRSSSSFRTGTPKAASPRYSRRRSSVERYALKQAVQLAAIVQQGGQNPTDPASATQPPPSAPPSPTREAAPTQFAGGAMYCVPQGWVQYPPLYFGMQEQHILMPPANEYEASMAAMGYPNQYGAYMYTQPMYHGVYAMGHGGPLEHCT